MVKCHRHKVPLCPGLVVVDIDSADQFPPVRAQWPLTQVRECQNDAKILPHSTIQESTRLAH